MNWAGHVACIVEMRNLYKVLAGKPEGKRALGRPSHRWAEGNMKIYFREIGCMGMDWIYLAQDMDQWQAVVNTVMNLWFHKRARNFLTC
jgi:hypothetical protein